MSDSHRNNLRDAAPTEVVCMHCRLVAVHIEGWGWQHKGTGVSDCGEPGRPTGLYAEPLNEENRP